LRRIGKNEDFASQVGADWRNFTVFPARKKGYNRGYGSEETPVMELETSSPPEE
jgi:hypothetical protein